MDQPSPTPPAPADEPRTQLKRSSRILLTALGTLALLLVAAVVVGPGLVWKLRDESSAKVVVLDDGDTSRTRAGVAWALANARVKDDKRVVNTWADVPTGDLDLLYLAESAQLPTAAQLDATEAKTVMAEFGAVDVHAPARAKKEGKPAPMTGAAWFGVRPTGWVGRCVSDLADRGATLAKIQSAWRARNKAKPWEFTGPGCVLVGPEDVYVLREGVEIDRAAANIELRPEGKRALGDDVKDVEWTGSFAFVTATDATALASLKLSTTAAGDAILAAAKIDQDATVAIAERDDGKHHRIFSAVDAADQTGLPENTDRAGTVWWHARYDDTPRRRFFWRLWLPLLNDQL
jgi:hypothetical protein